MNTSDTASAPEAQVNIEILATFLESINKKLKSDGVQLSLAVEGVRPFLEIKSDCFVLNEDGIQYFLTIFENILDRKGQDMDETIRLEEEKLTLLQKRIVQLSLTTKKEIRRNLERDVDEKRNGPTKDYQDAQQKLQEVLIQYDERLRLESELRIQRGNPARLKIEKRRFDQTKDHRIEELRSLLEAFNIRADGVDIPVTPAPSIPIKAKTGMTWKQTLLTAAAVIVIFGTVDTMREGYNRALILQGVDKSSDAGIKMTSLINKALTRIRMAGNAGGFEDHLKKLIIDEFHVHGKSFEVVNINGKYFYIDSADINGDNGYELATVEELQDAQAAYNKSSVYSRVKATLISHDKTTELSKQIQSALANSLTVLKNTGNKEQLVSQLKSFFTLNLGLDAQHFNIEDRGNGIYYIDRSDPKNQIFHALLIGSPEVQDALNRYSKSHLFGMTSAPFTIGEKGSIVKGSVAVAPDGTQTLTTISNPPAGSNGVVEKVQTIQRPDGTTEVHRIKISPGNGSTHPSLPQEKLP